MDDPREIKLMSYKIHLHLAHQYHIDGIDTYIVCSVSQILILKGLVSC